MDEQEQPDGWCFDCEAPLTIECVESEHLYQEAITYEQYREMAGIRE